MIQNEIEKEGKEDGVGMSDFLCNRERLGTALSSLLRITQHPEYQRGEGERLESR